VPARERAAGRPRNAIGELAGLLAGKRIEMPPHRFDEHQLAQAPECALAVGALLVRFRDLGCMN
jgi:hypothetical protein